MIAAFLLSGCATMGFDSKGGGYAWGQLNNGGRYAIISVNANQNVSFATPNAAPGKVIRNNLPAYSSQAALNQSAPYIFAQLDSIEGISLIDQREVFRLSQYQQLSNESNARGPSRFAANGYKILRAEDEVQRYAALAQALNVDAVLIVNLGFGYGNPAYVGPATTSVKVDVNQGNVMFWVHGYDAAGKKIFWSGKSGTGNGGSSLDENLTLAVRDAMGKQIELITRNLGR